MSSISRRRSTAPSVVAPFRNSTTSPSAPTALPGQFTDTRLYGFHCTPGMAARADYYVPGWRGQLRVSDGVPDVREILIDQRHRDGALPHCRSNSSGCPAAHVACRKNSRLTSLQDGPMMNR
jgi:hypothetical protein